MDLEILIENFGWIWTTFTSDCAEWSEYYSRVDMGDFEGNTCFVKYSIFQILEATKDYQLMIGGYSGDAGDSLAIK